jgi:FkbM family methyltransferase
MASLPKALAQAELFMSARRARETLKVAEQDNRREKRGEVGGEPRPYPRLGCNSWRRRALPGNLEYVLTIILEEMDGACLPGRSSGGMELGYLNLFVKMCLERFKNRKDLAHITYPELLLYAARQGFHLVRGTFSSYLSSITLDPELQLEFIVTPFGRVYFPVGFSRSELRMLCREAFDRKHWHQYDTEWTAVQEGDVVVDCGTAEGLWALTVVEKCGKLITIEPQETWVRCLEKTFENYCKLGKVVVIPVALADRDGEALLTADDGSISARITEGELTTNALRRVCVRRLDSLLKDEPRIDFIKADVEGAELQILRDAKSIIKNHKPKIAVTVYHQLNDWRKILGFVRSIVPAYQYALKGMVSWGKPLMLHMWCDDR